MTVGELKKLIADLPDGAPVVQLAGEGNGFYDALGDTDRLRETTQDERFDWVIDDGVDDSGQIALVIH